MGNTAVTVLAILVLLVLGALVFAVIRMISAGSKSGDKVAKGFAWLAALGLLWVAFKAFAG